MTFGYDLFNDKRFANNHQSGSDYRVLGTSSIIQGTGDSSVIFPQFLGDGTTIIQWNPIPFSSTGSNFRTHSAFYNDTWRVTDRITANLGVRYDKNDGQDQQGNTVITEDSWSPRVGVIYDLTGNGTWSLTGSAAKYITAINQSIADSASAGGNPQTRQFVYRSPQHQPCRNGDARRGGCRHTAVVRVVFGQRWPKSAAEWRSGHSRRVTADR